MIQRFPAEVLGVDTSGLVVSGETGVSDDGLGFRCVQWQEGLVRVYFTPLQQPVNAPPEDK